MQFKRILTLALVLSLSLVLAACGGTAPAAESTEAPAAESGGGESSNAATLSESASASVTMGGTVTVNYPSGWTATPMDGAGTVTLAGPEAGQVASVTFITSTMASALGDSPTAILTTQIQAFTSAAGAEVSEIAESEIGGNPAASVSITVAGVATYYYVISVDGGFAFLYGSDQATTEAIAASVSYAS